jgi:polyisoprenoid-binding protein YceI
MTETTEATKADYLIESGVSRFTVRGVAGGLLSGLGHNPIVAIPDFAGEAHWDPGEPQKAALRVTIRTASLAVQNDMSDKDRREIQRAMRDDVLEIDKYPEIVYESAAVTPNPGGRVMIDGNLTLHGVTRREQVTAQLAVTGEMLRAFGDFTIRQTDYQIKLASALGGALKMKDELKFSFDIVARKRTE